MLVGWLTVAGVIASANLTSEGSAHVEGGRVKSHATNRKTHFHNATARRNSVFIIAIH